MHSTGGSTVSKYCVQQQQQQHVWCWYWSCHCRSRAAAPTYSLDIVCVVAWGDEPLVVVREEVDEGHLVISQLCHVGNKRLKECKVLSRNPRQGCQSTALAAMGGLGERAHLIAGFIPQLVAPHGR